ncbi:hypothetical protein Ddc_03203 [Ditylenchus destructor]|nr:hypothetical protein Ddc_03203 [Ditylenchus destructor]
MHLRIFGRIFVILCVILFYTPESVPFKDIISNLLNGKTATNILHPVDKLEGLDYTNLIILFAYGVDYNFVNIPRPLDKLVSRITQEPDVKDILNKKDNPKQRVLTNEHLRNEIFDELKKIFPYEKPDRKLSRESEIERCTVNIKRTHHHDLIALAKHIIKKELPFQDPNEEISGEAALRIGAELYRSLYFVDGAHYKSINEEKYLRQAFEKEVIQKAKDKLEEDPEKYVEMVRAEKLQSIVNKFIHSWKIVKSIVKVLTSYRQLFYFHWAQKLGQELKVNKKGDIATQH